MSKMDLKLLGALLFFIGVYTLCECQQRSIPNIIINCYKNSTAYNRYTRQPMHIDNLIAIIRKIEKSTFYTWDMRRISRTILKKYSFDGLSYDSGRKQGFEFETDPFEDHKAAILYKLLGGEDTIPDGTLDNDESCALHWMLSSSINATLRDDESPNRLRAKRNAWPDNGDGVEIEQDSDKVHDYDADYENGDRVIANANANDEASRAVSGRLLTGKVISLDTSTAAAGKPETTTATIKKTESTSTSTKAPSSADLIPNIHQDTDEADHDFVEYQSDKEHYAPGKNVFARQINFPTSKQPIETGVVYTRWGPISAGKLIGGIAAGLEPMEMPVSDGTVFGSGVGSGSAGAGGSGSNPWGSGGGNNNNNNNNNQNSGFGSWSNSGQTWGSQRRNEPGYPFSSFQQQQGSRWKRQTGGEYLVPLLNLHAATLAGDVGQAAILNARHATPQMYQPPTGRFNDSICPREYILYSLQNPSHDVSHEHDTWTYMTAAEVRGGVDGLILGSQIQAWDRRNLYRLSQILEMYYSETGVSVEPRFRACDRSSNFPNIINQADLLAQSKSYAYVYNNRTKALTVSIADQNNQNLLNRNVEETLSKMTGFASSLGSMDPPCTQRVSSSANLDVPDENKIVPPQTTLYAVLDYSDTTDPDLTNQKNFIAQLAFDLNVAPFGSRIGLVNGASGQILIKPNATDNPASLACRIQSERTFSQNQNNFITTLESLKTEIIRIRTEEERTNYTDNNGIVIMVLNQGKKLEDSQKSETRSKISDYLDELGDVHVMFVTSKYNVNDYVDFVPDVDYDVIRVQANNGNLSSEAGRFKTEFLKRNHARLTYPQCNANRYDQDQEQRIGTDLYISPNTIQYYKISPDYFFSAKNLRFRFSSDNGKVRICVSRQRERFPNSQKAGTNGVECYETSGQYQPVGSSTADLEISYSKPCGGNGKREGCAPIFLSITPISSPVAGSIPLDCSADVCRSDQVKVSFSHWDMRCNSNSAVHTLVSLPGLFIAIAVSILTFTKYS